MTYLKIQNTEVFKKQRLPALVLHVRSLVTATLSKQVKPKQTGKQNFSSGSITQGRTQGKPLPAKLENQMG